VVREAPPERAQRVGGIAGAEPGLDIGDPEPGVQGQAAGAGQALGEGRHAARLLERVLRRDQPPHLVEAEPAQGLETDPVMALMGRIERAAEQPDPEAGLDGRDDGRGQAQPGLSEGVPLTA
jgi:hypothetical protein